MKGESHRYSKHGNLLLSLLIVAFPTLLFSFERRTFPLRIFSKTTHLSETRDDKINCALHYLSDYNNQYLQRQAKARVEGAKGTKESVVEFIWLQSLGIPGAKNLSENIRFHTKYLCEYSSEVVLGIKAESASQGISALTAWVDGLALNKGLLYAYNHDGNEINPREFPEDVSVYIKYNSTNSGNAYMKPFLSSSANGVIFQTILQNGSFYQFGDFPIFAFPIKTLSS